MTDEINGPGQLAVAGVLLGAFWAIWGGARAVELTAEHVTAARIAWRARQLRQVVRYEYPRCLPG